MSLGEINHCAILTDAATVRTFLDGTVSKLRAATVNVSNAELTWGNSLRPSSVSDKPRGLLIKRATPRDISNDLTCWLTADCVIPISSAAAVKLKRLAADSKARNQAKGGNALTMTKLSISFTNT